MTPVINVGPNAIPAAMTPLGLKGLSGGTFDQRKPVESASLPAVYYKVLGAGAVTESCCRASCIRSTAAPAAPLHTIGLPPQLPSWTNILVHVAQWIARLTSNQKVEGSIPFVDDYNFWSSGRRT